MKIVKNRVKIITKYEMSSDWGNREYIYLYYKNIKKGFLQPKWLLKSCKLESDMPKNKSYKSILSFLLEKVKCD